MNEMNGKGRYVNDKAISLYVFSIILFVVTAVPTILHWLFFYFNDYTFVIDILFSLNLGLAPLEYIIALPCAVIVAIIWVQKIVTKQICKKAIVINSILNFLSVAFVISIILWLHFTPLYLV